MQQFEICRLIWHCGATWIWPCTCRTSGTHVLFSRHVRGIAAGIPTHSGWRRTPGTAGTGICEQASGQVGYAGNGLTAFSDHRRLCPVGLFCGQHKQINIRSYMSIIGELSHCFAHFKSVEHVYLKLVLCSLVAWFCRASRVQPTSSGKLPDLPLASVKKSVSENAEVFFSCVFLKVESSTTAVFSFIKEWCWLLLCFPVRTALPHLLRVLR